MDLNDRETLFLKETFTPEELDKLQRLSFEDENEIRASFLTTLEDAEMAIPDNVARYKDDILAILRKPEYMTLRQIFIQWVSESRPGLFSEIVRATKPGQYTYSLKDFINRSDALKECDAHTKELFMKLLIDIYNINKHIGMQGLGKGEILFTILVNGQILHGSTIRLQNMNIELKAAQSRLMSGKSRLDSMSAIRYEKILEELAEKYKISKEDIFNHANASAYTSEEKSILAVKKSVAKTKSSTFLDFGKDAVATAYPALFAAVDELTNGSGTLFIADLFSAIYRNRVAGLEGSINRYVDELAKIFAEAIATGNPRKALGCVGQADLVAFALMNVSGNVDRSLRYIVLMRETNSNIGIMAIPVIQKNQQFGDHIEKGDINISKIGSDARDSSVGIEINKGRIL